MLLLEIIVNYTNFVVNILDPYDKKLVNTTKEITHRLTAKEFGDSYISDIKQYMKRKHMVEDKLYYVYDKHLQQYRFPIVYFKNFMLLLGNNGITKEQLTLTDNMKEQGSPLDLEFNKSITLRDYQEAYINVIVNEKTKHMLLVDLPTGMGKTVIALNAMVRLNVKSAIVVLPRYIDKWIGDVKYLTNVKDDQICVIQGSDTLHKLLKEDTDRYKFYIFSIPTLQAYIKDYESRYNEDSSYSYKVDPVDLMSHLGIGVLLNDEAHQHFHAMVRILLYLDLPKVLLLTATFTSNIYSKEKMYSRLVPLEYRVSNLAKYERYINVKAISYRLTRVWKSIRFRGAKGYSHVKYEQSILQNSVFLQNYMDMVVYYIEHGYVKRRQQGDKILIYFATVDMCTYATKYIQDKYPNLIVNRYTQADPYDNIMKSDISVSTNNSASTALDIPGLITVLQTVSISSSQLNLQSLGRLRKIPDREVWYYYFYCKDISSQVKMHNVRLETIKPRIKEYVFDSYYKFITT